jgi:excisionase family DNA binding protein
VSVVPSPIPAPEYFTAEQLGEMLQVDTSTVYRWAQRDPTMPAARIGGTVRFHRERVLHWLRDREQGSARPVRAMRRSMRAEAAS